MLKSLIIQASILAVFDRCHGSLCFLQKFKGNLWCSHAFVWSPVTPWYSFWTILIRKMVGCLIHKNLRMSTWTQYAFFPPSEGISDYGRNAVHEGRFTLVDYEVWVTVVVRVVRKNHHWGRVYGRAQSEGRIKPMLRWKQRGFPGGTSGKEPICQSRRHNWPWFDTWIGKIPWGRKWQPTPVFLAGKSHGQRSLVGYSPWGRKSPTWLGQLSMQAHTRKAEMQSQGILLVPWKRSHLWIRLWVRLLCQRWKYGLMLRNEPPPVTWVSGDEESPSCLLGMCSFSPDLTSLFCHLNIAL